PPGTNDEAGGLRRRGHLRRRLLTRVLVSGDRGRGVDGGGLVSPTDNVDHDHAHVVGAAPGVGLLDQRVGRLLRIVVPRQNLFDLGFLEHAEENVGAYYVKIPVAGVTVDHV